MRWHRVVFVVAASLLVSSGTRANLAELSAASTRRSLRAEKLAHVDNPSSYSTVTRHDDNMGDTADDSGERLLPENLKSLKTFKSIKQAMSQASKTFSEHVSPLLPMKARVQVWSRNEKSLDFVKKHLGMEHLAGTALKGSSNFQYYDDFVTSQLSVWAKKQLTPTEVKAELGLENLVDAVLLDHPNFKYYDEYLKGQVLVWGKENLGVDDVLVRLGLNTLAGTSRTEAANYQYYKEFVVNQIRAWLKDDVSVLDVMAKLKLDHLSGEALLSHPNYPFYKYFVKTKLKTWATNWVSEDEVAVRLGLEDLAGPALRTHPNYRFYVGTTNLKVYEEYVNMVDNSVLKLMKNRDKVPQNLVRPGASEQELLIKTQIWTSAKRPEEYIKYSLGLKGLEDDALKAAPNYQFYEYYLEARKHIE